ncbi:ABC transporter substrate-binding protein [Martelella soudanensis]|uniref:ABC transporter substrate-binding protein n=1 Tax=unclassified Martelella TaxID=2629616 RepID=UPI0015DD53E7|nr:MULTISPECIES: ABC transporter substrate-binding protein [unclassified Martelella]
MFITKLLTAGIMVAAAATSVQAQEFQIPDSYPSDYAQVLEGAKSEDRLLVYSNVSAGNWQPFIDLAKQKFPWMTIETTDDNSLWEKYFAESGSNVRTADLIVNTSPERWVDGVERSAFLDYKSPEIPNLPEWSITTGPGVYAASADPFILAYNKRAFAEPPKSIADVIAVYKDNPSMQGKVSTYTPERSIGMSLWKSWSESQDGSKQLIEQLGPYMTPDTSAGTMREKVMTGEYSAAIFTSGAGIRQYEQPAVKAVAGWVFAADGTPVLQRSVAITSAASSVNSAKLFLDLLLSREGQIAFANGGQTPYRADIEPDDVPYASLSRIIQEIGEDNIVFITPKADLEDGSEEFLTFWNEALGR